MKSLALQSCRLLVSVAFLLAWLGLQAQLNTADIVGTVTDPSGAAIAQARVTAKNVGTGLTRTTTTSQTGDYAFATLPIGTYSITVEAPGFKKTTVPNITLATGDRPRANVQMEVGNVSETVHVEATAPALQTESATVAGLINDKAVQDLPIPGRNLIFLAQLAPGASEGNPAGFGSGTRPDDRRQTSEITANSQDNRVNNRTIDGMDNNERLIGTIGVQPSIDAIQEMKVQTNLYTAEVGRTAGAVVDIVTKSGTNSFHGSAYEYLRNDIFDARNYFATPSVAPEKPKYRQNQFGGSLGGPINKDKTFFFADYEGYFIRQGITPNRQTVPTDCEQGRAACNGVTQLGNFSDLLTPNSNCLSGTPAQRVNCIYDPTTGAWFTNNIIPLSRINPVSKNVASLLPTPNLPGLKNNFGSVPTRTQDSSTADARVDHHFNESNSLSARYTINDVTTFTPGTFPAVNFNGVTIQPGGQGANQVNSFAGTAAQRAQTLALAYTHVFSPTLLMQTNLGYLRVAVQSVPLNEGTNAAQAVGMTGINVNADSTALPRFDLTNGYSFIGDDTFIPEKYFDNVYQATASLSWARGSHSLKFGGAAIRRVFSIFQSPQPDGVFTFNTAVTSLATVPGTGNTFASFLLGYPASVSRQLTLIRPTYETWEPSGYAQDSWRARSWLTLNFGVRYDVFTAWKEHHNQMSNLDPVRGILVAASPDDRTALVNTDYSNVAPRFGFAVSLPHAAVIRGGWGMSYYPGALLSQARMTNPPFTANFGMSTSGTASKPFNPPVYTTPLPPPVPTPITNPTGTINAVSPDLRSSYVYQTNLMLQKDFSGNVISIGYVGIFGHRLVNQVNIDQLNTPGPQPPGTPATIAIPNPAQPFFSTLPGVSTISYLTSIGSSNYNALQASFERRYKNGLTLSTNYTWGHMLDNTYLYGQQNFTECIYANCIVDNGDGTTHTVKGSDYDYGNGDNDLRHRWTLSVNYELPFGKSLTGFARQAIQGWQINSVATYSSGTPINIRESVNQARTGATVDARPNQVGDPSVSNPSPAQWFNQSAFALQRVGTLGNVARNSLSGPPQRRWDFSLFKAFPITEAARLQFRWEVFNLTNTPNFAFSQANRTLGAAEFGTITATTPGSSARDMQFALKLLF